MNIPNQVEGIPAIEAINTRMEPILTLDFFPEYCRTAPMIIKVPQIAPMTKKTIASPDGISPRPNDEKAKLAPTVEYRANQELIETKAKTSVMMPPTNERMKAIVGLSVIGGFHDMSGI